jgi:integrase
MLPITPDFAAFLLETPEGERKGRVFKLPGRERTRSSVSHVLADIGVKAGVKVDERTKKGKAVIKCASAHDLRRSFGERWAARVMPNVLQELMRHESISTTMKFYVGRNAERTADAVWAARDQNGNTFGNSQPASRFHDECGNDANTCDTSTSM